jgi:outer membrane lipoprotein SlyB
MLAACAQPIGPTVQVLPPPGKSFEAFQADQRDCSIYTNAQIRPMVDRAATAELGTAMIGTALGAGLGAAIGGGRGAGIGAASGAIVGTATGGDQNTQAQSRIQVFYDNTFAACMVSRGDVLPAAPQPAQIVIMPPPAVVVQQAPYVIQPTAPAQH